MTCSVACAITSASEHTCTDRDTAKLGEHVLVPCRPVAGESVREVAFTQARHILLRCRLQIGVNKRVVARQAQDVEGCIFEEPARHKTAYKRALA
jgi:hypothetical protein